MSEDTDVRLCEMKISTLPGSTHQNYIIEWAKDKTDRAIIGIGIYEIMILSNAIAGNYRNCDGIMTAGIVSPVSPPVAGEQQTVCSEIRLDKFTGENSLDFTEIEPMSRNKMLYDDIKDASVNETIMMSFVNSHYTLAHKPMIAADLNRSVFLDERKSIIGTFAKIVKEIMVEAHVLPGGSSAAVERASVRMGKIIASNAKDPNLTYSAECCVLMLGIITLMPRVFNSKAKQELIGYSRKIIEAVRLAKNYENDIHANIIEAVEKQVGPVVMTQVSAKLKAFGLHLSSYIGIPNTRTDGWLEGTLVAICKLVVPDCAACKMCGRNAIRPIPGPYFDMVGKKTTKQTGVLTPSRIFVTLLAFQFDASPYRWMLSLLSVETRSLILSWISNAEPLQTNEYGYITEEIYKRLVVDLPQVVADMNRLVEINNTSKIVGYELTKEEQIEHLYAHHAEELQLPARLPGVVELFESVGVAPREAGIVGEFLSKGTKHNLPIIKSTVLIPHTWSLHQSPPQLYAELLIRKSYVASIELTYARLHNAMDLFYSDGTYDAMKVFAENTDILSRNEAFDAIIPPKLAVPHAFQRAYVNRLLANMTDAINTHALRGAAGAAAPIDDDDIDPKMIIPDPTLVIDLEQLSTELHIPPQFFGGLPEKFVAYVTNLSNLMTTQCGVNINTILFMYACRRSTSYERALITNVANNRNRFVIAAIALLRTRQIGKYKTPISDKAERFKSLHESMLATTGENTDDDEASPNTIYAAQSALVAWGAKVEAEAEAEAEAEVVAPEAGSDPSMSTPVTELETSVVSAMATSTLGISVGVTEGLKLQEEHLRATPVTSEFDNTSMAGVSPMFGASRHTVGSFDYEGTAFNAPRPTNQPTPGASPMSVLTESDVLAFDIAALLVLSTKLSKVNDITIVENTGPIKCDFMNTNAGSGKTSAAKMGGCEIRTVKTYFEGKLPPFNFEQVYVCDQPLVRSEIFGSMKKLGSQRCRTSLASLDATGRVIIKSNFKVQKTRMVGGRVRTVEEDPTLKCSSRDMFIMSSEVLILYVLGRRDGSTLENDNEGGWHGNHRAFVFIDEYCAWLGDIAASESLAESGGNEMQIVRAFQRYAQAMLILSNSTSMLTLVGATMVPHSMIKNTINDHQSRHVEMNPISGGKIYVGSQIVLPWNEEINLWNICPQELLGDLFIGFKEPLLRRTVGHYAALQLREKIIAATKISGPEAVMYSRLLEMSEYLFFDLGVYNGDSIANYAVGLLYFIYLYAHQYVAPAPGLSLYCGDMAGQLDMLEIPLPKFAPWPKSHFVRQSEMYRIDANPAPPDFLAGLGISGAWNRGPRPEAVRLACAKGMIADLNSSGDRSALADKLRREIYSTAIAVRESFPIGLELELFVESRQPPIVPLAPAPGVVQTVTEKAAALALAKTKAFVYGATSISAGDVTPWTTTGRIVQDLRTCISNARVPSREVTLVLDVDPEACAVATLAAYLHITPEALRSRAEATITSAKNKYEARLADNRRIAEEQLARDGKVNGNVVAQNEHGDGNVTKKFVANDGGINNDGPAIITSDVNPITNRAYICEGAPEMSNIEMYLLSFDVCVISNDCSEYQLMKIYEFIKSNVTTEKNIKYAGRIGMIFLPKMGSFGINLDKATRATVTLRTSCNVSVQILKQFFCRAGREGMSDNAFLTMDLVTLVRLLEDGIHTTDGALFPNLYIVLEKFRTSGSAASPTAATSYRSWVQNIDEQCASATAEAVAKMENLLRITNERNYQGMKLTRWNWRTLLGPGASTNTEPFEEAELEINTIADTITRRALVALLNTRVLEHGQSNRDCEIIEMLVGAVQYHLHEPFGIPNSINIGSIGPIWPRRSDGGSETELLLTCLENVMRMFSQARDRSTYSLYERFMLVRTNENTTAATRYVKTIAENMRARITNSTYNNIEASVDNDMDDMSGDVKPRGATRR